MTYANAESGAVNDYGWIWAAGSGSATEVKVMDAAGNKTTISPHDDNGEWVFHSQNDTTKRVLHVKMEKLLKRLNDQFGEPEWWQDYIEED